VAERDVAGEWDAEALVFDDEPHHAIAEPGMRAAWADVLRDALPPAPATVADLGCGTGSVSVLLAELGHVVHGLDVSPEMVARARAKAAAHGIEATFEVGDAGDPQIPDVDVVLTRHVAWAVADLEAAVGRWVAALNPRGRLVLVEGLWSNGAGVAATDLADVVRRHLPDVSVHELDDRALWGYPLVDSRYLLVARAAA
jgi:SAM-dependent methyltransferase